MVKEKGGLYSFDSIVTLSILSAPLRPFGAPARSFSDNIAWTEERAGTTLARSATKRTTHASKRFPGGADRAVLLVLGQEARFSGCLTGVRI
jgi:hypothetical protein